MKIDYKILWLDDKIQDFIDDELVEELERFLEEQGFRPVIDFTSSITEFFENLNETYDLIMTDYHMKDMNGDEVVKRIRSTEYSILTEILFYTARADLKDTNKISRVSFLETNTKTGTHQDVLIEETKKLIGLTIKKFQNIVAMRGMIMHETSSLDNQMLSIIKKALESSSINFDTLAVQIYDDLDAHYKEKSTLVSECRTKNKFKKLTKDNLVFSADYKVKTLGQILVSLKITDFSGAYKDEINSVRNKFAHAVLEKDPLTGREYFKHGDSGMTFDEELCRKIRNDINKYRDNFDQLLMKIPSNT
jgi:CheY-like chemotaxis protein